MWNLILCFSAQITQTNGIFEVATCVWEDGQTSVLTIWLCLCEKRGKTPTWCQHCWLWRIWRAAAHSFITFHSIRRMSAISCIWFSFHVKNVWQCLAYNRNWYGALCGKYGQSDEWNCMKWFEYKLTSNFYRRATLQIAFRSISIRPFFTIQVTHRFILTIEVLDWCSDNPKCNARWE